MRDGTTDVGTEDTRKSVQHTGRPRDDSREMQIPQDRVCELCVRARTSLGGQAWIHGLRTTLRCKRRDARDFAEYAQRLRGGHRVGEYQSCTCEQEGRGEVRSGGAQERTSPCLGTSCSLPGEIASAFAHLDGLCVV